MKWPTEGLFGDSVQAIAISLTAVCYAHNPRDLYI